MALQSLLISISAIGVISTFPPFNLYWLLPFSLLPFIYTIKKTKQPILYSTLFGLIYMGLTNYWIFELIEFSSVIEITFLFIGYTLIETLFFTLMGLLIHKTHNSLWSIPSCWVITEWLRSIGPFGSANGIIAYSQANNALINHTASLGGVYFTSFICISLSCLIYALITSIHSKNIKKRNFISISIALIIFSSYGYKLPEKTKKESLNIGIIQTYYPISYKQQPKNRKTIRQGHLDLSTKAAQSTPLDLIIWPETITASQNLKFTDFMKKILKLSNHYNTAFILGTPRKKEKKYYNSAVFLHKNAIHYYDKIFLMPFGEYWPFKSIFTFFKLNNIIPGSEFKKGKITTPFYLNNIKLAPGICLETTVPQFYRKHAQQDHDVLISLVNNGWFKTTSIAERQFQMLQFRSIETGLPSIQSSNFGISGIIDAKGKTITKLPKFTHDYLTHTLTISKIKTPYTTLGNIIILLSFLCILIKMTRFRIRNVFTWL